MNNKNKAKFTDFRGWWFGKSVAEVATSLGIWHEIFVDDSWPSTTEINNYKIISDILNLSELNLYAYQAIVAVGNNGLRHKWYKILDELNIPLASVIDPTSILCSSVKVADGVIIMAGCVVGAAVKIQSGAILNLGTLIDHDVEIGSCAHFKHWS